MKIDALFVENKANLGKPQFAGYVPDFDDVPELCAYALPNFFADKDACKTFAKKMRECLDQRGDPEGFFDSISKTKLYGWTTTWKIVKNDITIYVMKQLQDLLPLKVGSGLNESLNRLEEDHLTDDVRSWVGAHYDEYDSQDREDLLDDVNYKAEMYLDMLVDLSMETATNEKKDFVYDVLKDTIENYGSGNNAKKTDWYEEWLKNKKPVKCPECHLDFEAIPAIEPDTYVCPSCGKAFK